MVQVEISSKSYVIGLTKEKVLQDIYKIFYNRIVNNVTKYHSSKWWFPAWPDKDIDNKDSYPLGILEVDLDGWEKSTLAKKKVNATVTAEVYSTAQDQLDSISDEVITAIERSTGIYRNINLRFVNLAGTDTNHSMRGKITVHQKVIRFTCSFTFTKTY